MSEAELSDNGVEPICRHQSIASANEVFSGVTDPALPASGIFANDPPFGVGLVSYRNYGSSLYWSPAEWRRMTVDQVPSTRHFDTVCAFFRCATTSPRIPECPTLVRTVATSPGTQRD
jgi:hypothetical protein